MLRQEISLPVDRESSGGRITAVPMDEALTNLVIWLVAPVYLHVARAR
jgi:hypothetical protein